MLRTFLLVLVGAGGAAALAGCARSPSPTDTPPKASAQAAPSRHEGATRLPETLPLHPELGRLPSLIVDSLNKRVMGRRASLGDIRRIVTQVEPIVARAARQPWAQRPLRQIAQDNGLTLEQARQRWVALQEADLLLESGGDPEAVSISDAVGVAQWLAGTAKAHGLSVDAAASQQLTRQIDTLKRRIAWIRYLLRPDADPSAPGAPRITRAEAMSKLPILTRELETLRARRRRVDARYDPQQAIFAQTRYLLRLYERFPSLDWVFQAYHGGEAGVERTLRAYLGPAWPGSARTAIQSGRRAGGLRFEDLYLTTTPRARPAAFAYLYGRSDDHRYYWWKLRAAENALALYRRDPAAFHQQWEAYLPGRAKEAFWYPDGPAQALANLPALQQAHAQRRLVPVKKLPFLVVPNAPLDVPQARWYAAVRPPAKGALILVAAAYARIGGSKPLVTGDLTLTQAYVDRARALYPPSGPKPPLWPPDLQTLPGGGPAPDFDFHTTGIAFDLEKPSVSADRKTLLYALGWCADRQILWWREDEARGTRHYHVVPNPHYAVALARIAASERAPALSW